MAEFESGTADIFGGDEDLSTLAGTDETSGGLESGATDGAETTSDSGRLIDPATLPDDLKPHWSRMTQAHNRRLDAIKEREAELGQLEQKADVVDRFYSDPQYAQQVIQQMAGQLGMQLVPQGQQPVGTTAQTGQGMTDSVLDKANAAFAERPDLQFLAPMVAKVAQAIAEEKAQEAVQPFRQQQEAQAQQHRRQEYQQAVGQLSEQVPGWEEHEDDMLSVWQFLQQAAQGGSMLHPRYGSVLGLLHRLATGDAAATAEAGRRMQRSLTSRTTTGSAAPAPAPNVLEQIANTDDRQGKWGLAFRDALATVRREQQGDA